MDKYKNLYIIPLISELLLLFLLFYYKLKKYFNISFNSFYLFIFCIFSRILYHLLSFKEILSNKKFYIWILLIIFIFSYITRIKRLLDCISISKILKSQKIKNKSKILFEKSYYGSENIYLIIFFILTFSIILLFYFLPLINFEKYIVFFISYIILSIFVFKILLSDMRKKLKRNYISEIILFLLLVSNLIYFELSYKEETESSFCQCVLIFIFEILFIMSVSFNFGIFSKMKISKDKFLINKKLKSDFCLFFNNELCFYAFNSYLNKNDPDSNILMKLYLDINKNKMKIILNENSNDIKILIEYFDNNKQSIKNSKLKENLEKNFENIKEKLNENKYESILFDEVFVSLNNEMNKKFDIFKGSGEYEKLFSFLDLIYFLDEKIFVESFYFDYINNEELDGV